MHKTMRDKCKLCEKVEILRKSHFIPKFVGKWIKKTSLTGYMRDGHNINKRIQDFPTKYWLCDSCEQLFSVWEQEFAQNVFYPFSKQSKATVSYQEWMPKFCASISWRALTYFRYTNKDDVQLKDLEIELNKAQSCLTKYLLRISPNLFQYEQHLIPHESINFDISTEFSTYLQGTVNMDIIISNNNKNIIVFTIIPYFIFLGIIDYDKVNKMRSSRIALSDGKIYPKADCYVPDTIKEYIINTVVRKSIQFQDMSEKQKNKIEASMKKS